MSVTQNAKAAMKAANIGVSEGTDWTPDDHRKFVDFLYFNHGVGRDQAGGVLAYPESQGEPLRSILLGDVDAEAATENAPTDLAEADADKSESEEQPEQSQEQTEEQSEQSEESEQEHQSEEQTDEKTGEQEQGEQSGESADGGEEFKL